MPPLDGAKGLEDWVVCSIADVAKTIKGVVRDRAMSLWRTRNSAMVAGHPQRVGLPSWILGGHGGLEALD